MAGGVALEAGVRKVGRKMGRDGTRGGGERAVDACLGRLRACARAAGMDGVRLSASRDAKASDDTGDVCVDARAQEAPAASGKWHA